MSNRLEELHYQYKRYYLKKILRLVGILVVVSSILGIGYLLIQDENYIQKPQPQSKIIEKVDEIVILSITSPSTKDSRKAYSLDVSVDELEASVHKIKAKNTPKIEYKKVSKTKVLKKAEVKKKVITKPLVQEEVRTSFFTDAQADKSLDAWIEKYNKKRSYSTAIYIAKQYYFDEEYKQAGIWAKRANQLNRNKEEAWLFYAKSVYVLGNIPKAKRILNIYLQYKKSTKAELLLSEWSK
ncbi:MAG: hypothetical protein COA44_12080 [Arcobacter sp.]|nr:MAG: hypothetical protein COA44_12080 [Arcobacter sp.]